MIRKPWFFPSENVAICNCQFIQKLSTIFPLLDLKRRNRQNDITRIAPEPGIQEGYFIAVRINNSRLPRPGKPRQRISYAYIGKHKLLAFGALNIPHDTHNVFKIFRLGCFRRFHSSKYTTRPYFQQQTISF